MMCASFPCGSACNGGTRGAPSGSKAAQLRPCHAGKDGGSKGGSRPSTLCWWPEGGGGMPGMCESSQLEQSDADRACGLGSMYPPHTLGAYTLPHHASPTSTTQRHCFHMRSPKHSMPRHTKQAQPCMASISGAVSACLSQLTPRQTRRAQPTQ
jgi:hypothetical protein